MEEENLNIIKDRTIIKNVLFFRISTDEPAMIVTDERLKIIKNKFNNSTVIFKNKINNSTEFVIKEISKNNDFFFGSICKTDDNLDPFTKLTFVNTESTLENDEILFNHYTYFYLDYKTLYISCIISKNIQSPDKYIANFLNHNNFGTFRVIPLAKSLKDINNYINSFRLSFVNNSDFKELNILPMLDCDVKDYKIYVKLKSKGDKFLDSLKSFVNKNKKHLRIASVGNCEEDYDLIKDTFSKKAKIKIPTDYEDKIDTIRLLLEEELIKAK